MNKQMLERITELYDAGQVRRKHTVVTIKQHTIAEHVYGSLIIATELCKLNKTNAALRNLNLDGHRVLLALLYHDAPEVYTGDIPAPVKRAHEALNSEIERMEERFVLKMGIDLPKLNDFESAIVKASDTLDLSFTCLHERLVGNRHPRLKQMFMNTMEYITKQQHLAGVSDMVKHLQERWNNV